MLPAPPPLIAQGAIIRDRIVAHGLGAAGQLLIERLRFAGSNRLIVELDYVDKEGRFSSRPIEAYSLRRSQAGDIRLMAAQAVDGQPRAFLLDGIRDARITQRTFRPRYPIELVPTGFQPIGDATPSLAAPRRFQPALHSPRPVRQPRLRRFKSPIASNGPTYVFRCPVCGKQFSTKSMDASLNRHKNAKTGNDCYGTIGTFVRTRY